MGYLEAESFGKKQKCLQVVHYLQKHLSPSRLRKAAILMWRMEHDESDYAGFGNIRIPLHPPDAWEPLRHIDYEVEAYRKSAVTKCLITWLDTVERALDVVFPSHSSLEVLLLIRDYSYPLWLLIDLHIFQQKAQAVIEIRITITI